MDGKGFGFQEIPHTADWALKVWAPDLPRLFALAALGMYSLMEVVLWQEDRTEKSFELDGMDVESLLVAFLSELLYYGESEGYGFDQFEVDLKAEHLKSRVWGTRILEQRKEIKAVTYHNLSIRQVDQLYQVTIVFDV